MIRGSMIPKSIQKILNTLEQNGFEAYLVGGFVRDTLLNRKTNDFDIATNAKPKDLLKIFSVFKENIEYGSFHLKVENYTVDITTYRKELKYENNHLTEIEYTSNLLEDISRRDFTINAMYMNKKGILVDPYHYKEDIENKIIRTIGNARVRFQEDPIRILRAIRFAAMFHFKLDKKLIYAMKKEKKRLLNIPVEPIQKELDRILLSNGFPILKKLHLLTVLGITSKKIVYVNDLVGLWAQISSTKDYHKEKNFQKRKKNIVNLLKCGTIKLFDLYEYGYYDCKVVATILNFPMPELEKMNASLPMHSRKKMAMNGKEIEEYSLVHKEELGLLIRKIEEQILSGKLKNEKESIQQFLKNEVIPNAKH